MPVAEHQHEERQRRAYDGGGDARTSIEARIRGRVEIIARRWSELR
jgi:hypothetical protein